MSKPKKSRKSPNRIRKNIGLTLLPPTIVALQELADAKGVSMSAMVSGLVMDEAQRRLIAQGIKQTA